MTSLTKGQILEDTYQIMGEIGAGGGGIVFRARHIRLQTDVVIKKIKDEIREKVNLRQEADLLKNLKHPYLPRVYDFIEREDGVYTVMDYIHGEDMDTAIKKHGKFTQKEVRKWAQQLGDVLSYLHSQNPPIIHSDIKPANIMLTEGGDICLIDFNISLAAGFESKTAVGISVGFSPPEQYRDPALYERMTHNYISKHLSQRKEQKEEEDRTQILNSEASVPAYTVFMGRGIDTRSDIYSLGITLYYLLTGIEPPIDFEQRIPIGHTGTKVSEGFAQILEKMMELNPDQRYQNGKEFYRAVQNCHKLDRRYIAMRRTQNGMQAAALTCLILGILLLFAGADRKRKEDNAEYFALVEQAGIRMEEHQIEEALLLINTAKQMMPQRIRAYEEEIYLLYQSGDYEGCIRQGENYLNTYPFAIEEAGDETALGNICFIIGNAFMEQKDYANARQMLELSIDYYPYNGIYYRDYAIVLAKLGQLDEAEVQLQRGMELGLPEDSVSMAKGELAQINAEPEKALQEFEQAIRLTEDTQIKRRAILLSADIYRGMGDKAIDREISLLEQYSAEAQETGSLVILEYLGNAYARKAALDAETADKYYNKALGLFEQIWAQGYTTYQLQENISVLYQNMDRFDEAEEILMQVIQMYPERYGPYKRLAFLEADRQQEKNNELRDYLKMKEYYEMALTLYDTSLQDVEMQMLDQMMKDLEEGGWF